MFRLWKCLLLGFAVLVGAGMAWSGELITAEEALASQAAVPMLAVDETPANPQGPVIAVMDAGALAQPMKNPFSIEILMQAQRDADLNFASFKAFYGAFKIDIDAKDISVPGDISSAAFMIILALISKNSKVTIKNVLLNPTRTGILDVLKKMKAKIKIKNKKTVCGEIVGDIEAKSSNLKATTVPEKMAPRLIDEYPILFIAACFAKGTSNFKGIEELRVKESDRIKSMEDGLKPLGVKVSSTKSSVKITGTNSFKLNKKIKIDAKGDHRIAMSFYVLSQVLNKSFKIKDFNYVKTSFPSFTKTINTLKKN